MNRLALEQLAIERRDRVLEIGFGGGDLLEAILGATTGQVSGADVSAAMVARAQRRFRADMEQGRLRIFRVSVEQLPLGDETVDKLCTVNSLYFWPDAPGAMAEFRRVLAPGGRIAICFEPAEEVRKWPGHRYGFRLYEEEEVIDLLRAAGFGDFCSAWGRGRKPDRFVCVTAEKGAA